MLFLNSLFQFEKPGRRENFDYPDMAKEAGMKFKLDRFIESDCSCPRCSFNVHRYKFYSW